MTVVAPTVTIMTQASALGSPGANLGKIVCMAMVETTSDPIIALSSDQALILVQYHRRMSTNPVPAPIASKYFCTRSIDESCVVTAMATANNPIVASREAAT